MPADPEESRARRAAILLATHRTVIAAALRSHSEHMSAAAGQAQTRWEALEADPAAREAHEASGAVITARGYQAIAQVFGDNAAAATAALDDLDALTSPQQPDETVPQGVITRHAAGGQPDRHREM
jgi:hypothetical protein